MSILSRVWSVSLCVLLHLRECCLAFGGFVIVICSNPESFLSRLEGVGLRIAPIMRAFSRFWRVYCCVLLHLREPCLVIGVDSAVQCSICENLLSCLEGLELLFAPNPRTLSRFWRVLACVLLHLRESALVNGGGWFKSATMSAYLYANLL